MKKMIVILCSVALSGCVQTQTVYNTAAPISRTCGYVEQPIYRTVYRQVDAGQVLAGGVVGGVLANVIFNGDAGATNAGILIGAAIGSQQTPQRVVVGSRKVWVCR